MTPPSPIEPDLDDRERVEAACVVRHLAVHGDLSPILVQMRAERAAARAAGERGLGVSVSELRAAMDTFRQARGLTSGAATSRWLADHHLSLIDLEDALGQALLAEKFKDVLAADRAGPHVAAHPDRYARARLRWLVAPSEGAAQEIRRAHTEDGVPFADLPRSVTPAAPGGSLGVVGRWRLPVEASDAIFSAEAGSVVGPVRLAQG